MCLLRSALRLNRRSHIEHWNRGLCFRFMCLLSSPCLVKASLHWEHWKHLGFDTSLVPERLSSVELVVSSTIVSGCAKAVGNARSRHSWPLAYSDTKGGGKGWGCASSTRCCARVSCTSGSSLYGDVVPPFGLEVPKTEPYMTGFG